ncbi:MAG: type IV pilus secretin PilQ [Thermodesulfovibrionales bacterium]|nr:type IV pilus secretin PilQ [Thermodesulfovibrionales bacterium]
MKKRTYKTLEIRKIKDFFNYQCLLKQLILCVALLFLFFSFVSAKQIEITNITVNEDFIKIESNAPLSYSIFKASDPFTTVVDFENTSLGKFKEKISPKNSIISEIRPSQINNPIPMARLEILLSDPLDIVPQVKEGALFLQVKLLNNPKNHTTISNETKNAKKITLLKFEKAAESVELILKGDGNMPEPEVTETSDSITLFIPNVTFFATLPTNLPPPIKDIKYTQEKDGLKFNVNFSEKIDPLAFAFSDELIIDIPYKPNKQKTQEKPKQDHIKEAPTQQTQQPVKIENSKLITLDFQDADVVAVLRLLADVSGKNIIIHPEVKGKISMKLVNVPWEQALDVTLKSHNLIKIAEGNVIRVVPIKNLQEETKLLAELKEVQKRAEDLHTEVFIVNYANVEKIKDSIEKSKILTKDLGSISIDHRTRTITVKDIQPVILEVAKIIKSVDKPTKQVLIEARIVELNSKYSRGLGVEWGFKARPFNWESAIVGSVSPSIPGGADSPGLINLPAATGSITEPTSAITFGYLNRKQTLGLDLRLSAIENVGKGRIISKPRIITGDNQKAKIVQGESIPYGERTTTGGVAEITTKFKDVAVTIEVTPQITDDNSILLDVLVNKEDLIEFVNIGGGTLAPRTSKLESRTNLLLENGETMVIGGIYKKDERDNEDRVPFVASIPIVGELFKKTVKEDDVKEFLIFLTPKIVIR